MMSPTTSECSSLALLSPCSSSATLIPPDECDLPTSTDLPTSATTASSLWSSPDRANASNQQNPDQAGNVAANRETLTVIMPDGRDRVSITMDQIGQFVTQHAHQPLSLTVFHLILYLLANHARDASVCVNHIKLFHMGKQYAVHTLGDLNQPQALLQHICRHFCTFQLMYTANLVSVPLALPVEDLVRRTAHIVTPSDPDSAVTYTDAMRRIIRKSSRRKSSVASMESAAQTVSRGSGTDVEDAGSCGAKGQRSWKRMFRKQGSPRAVNVH